MFADGLLDGLPLIDTFGIIVLVHSFWSGEHMAFLLGFLRICPWPYCASLPGLRSDPVFLRKYCHDLRTSFPLFIPIQPAARHHPCQLSGTWTPRQATRERLHFQAIPFICPCLAGCGGLGLGCITSSFFSLLAYIVCMDVFSLSSIYAFLSLSVYMLYLYRDNPLVYFRQSQFIFTLF